jgi:flagellar protein FliL
MKKIIIIAGVLAVVLLAAGYFFVMPMLKGKPVQAVEEEETETVSRSKKPKRQPEPELVYPITERILNLMSTNGTPHFARIELAIEFEVPKGAKLTKPAAGGAHGAPATGPAPLDPLLEPVEARKVQIDDLVLRIIGSKTLEEMTTAEGKEAVKQELIEELEKLIEKPEPINVYIVRLVVQ